MIDFDAFGEKLINGKVYHLLLGQYPIDICQCVSMMMMMWMRVLTIIRLLIIYLLFHL